MYKEFVSWCYKGKRFLTDGCVSINTNGFALGFNISFSRRYIDLSLSLGLLYFGVGWYKRDSEDNKLYWKDGDE